MVANFTYLLKNALIPITNIFENEQLEYIQSQINKIRKFAIDKELHLAW